MEPTFCSNCHRTYKPNRCLVGWDNTHEPPSLYKFCRDCGYTTYYDIKV